MISLRKNDWNLILLSLLSGVVSGYIAAMTFSLGSIPYWSSAHWLQVISPGLAFGLLTFWFSVYRQNNRILRSLVWIVLCPITFYFTLLLAIGGSSPLPAIQLSLSIAGFVGAIILMTGSHFLFSKSSFIYKIVVALAAGIISPLAFSDQYLLFILWQTLLALAIGFSLREQ